MKIYKKDTQSQSHPLRNLLDSLSSVFSKSQQAEETVGNSANVFCPYCQKKFSLDSVLFRAENVADGVDGGFFTAKQDDIFLSFWQDTMMWKSSAKLREFEDDYSVVAANYTKGGTLIESVRFCLLDKLHIKEVHRDETGIIESVTDTRGVVTNKRVCPHCHSLLPQNYGKGEIHFISIVGIKGSGKTIFLSKLFSNATELFQKGGLLALQSATMSRFAESNRIVAGQPLTGGTPPGQINPPIFMNFLDAKLKLHTLVFYDIAGEDCLPTAKLDELGKFIGISDATIMLISPKQLPNLVIPDEDDAEVENTNISSVFSAIAQFYGIPEASRTHEKCSLRLAVTVSKSDLLRNATLNGEPIYGENSPIFHNVSYPAAPRGFAVAQAAAIEGEIVRRINTSELHLSISQLYENTHYFAVSSLGESPSYSDGKKLAPNSNCTRIEEPLFWILSELGIIENI